MVEMIAAGISDGSPSAPRGRRVVAVLSVSVLFLAGLVTAHLQDRGTEPRFNASAVPARQMVRQAGSLWSFSASPTDPAVRAAVWDVCANTGPCSGQHLAMAVTRDGYATASYFLVSEASGVRWVGGDSFAAILGNGDVALVSAVEAPRILSVSHQPAPMGPGEVLLYAFPRRNAVQPVAVNPTMRTAHVLPSLPDDEFAAPELRNGLLWSTAGDLIATSSNGGVSWQTHPDAPRAMVAVPVTSDAPRVDALLAEGDDPLARAVLARTADNGATWQWLDPKALPDAWPLWSAIMPSGQLLAMYDGPVAGGNVAFVRLYVSDTSSWTSFHAVDIPEHGPELSNGRLATTTSHQGQQGLYVQDDSTVLASFDEGRTWTTVRTR